MNRRGFSLIEMVVVLVVLVVLLAILSARVTGLRDAAVVSARADALATLQRMQQLADLEELSQTNTDVLARILELQSGLAARGHASFKIDPAAVSKLVTYTVDTTTHWSLLP